jgi:hypothetical protein
VNSARRHEPRLRRCTAELLAGGSVDVADLRHARRVLIPTYARLRITLA